MCCLTEASSCILVVVQGDFCQWSDYGMFSLCELLYPRLNVNTEEFYRVTELNLSITPFAECEPRYAEFAISMVSQRDQL